MTSNYQTPTAETYNGLEQAFNHFNRELFDERLPPVMFTITRKRGAHGYFWAEQFKHREDGDTTHEIALNPDTMGRELEEVLSTLVHEMTHLEQQEYGTPGKKGYHNEAWAQLMDRVGLEPQPRTGRKVSHAILPDGAFAASCASLLQRGFDLPYFTQPVMAAEKKKDTSKVKITCPCCGVNAWAKQGVNIMCGDCEEHMQ